MYAAELSTRAVNVVNRNCHYPSASVSQSDQELEVSFAGPSPGSGVPPLDAGFQLLRPNAVKAWPERNRETGTVIWEHAETPMKELIDEAMYEKTSRRARQTPTSRLGPH